MGYTVYYLNTETERNFSDLTSAKSAAENFCGNGRYNKPFPNEEVFLYGPGDGTTSVMIRRTRERK
jgi:hypothetical protein